MPRALAEAYGMNTTRHVTIPARQIAFSVDANFHGPSEGPYVAEYVLTFHNKGNTRVEGRRRLRRFR
jgi:hypothetical protein